MRILFFTLGACLILSSGCQVIPTDMFPKVKWYWSKEAEQYRADKAAHNPQKHN